jgi:hypothetical protein
VNLSFGLVGWVALKGEVWLSLSELGSSESG